MIPFFLKYFEESINFFKNQNDTSNRRIILVFKKPIYATYEGKLEFKIRWYLQLDTSCVLKFQIS